MNITINFWAVLVSAIASLVVGSIWYGPLFGKMFMMGHGHEFVVAGKANGHEKEHGSNVFVAVYCQLSYVLRTCENYGKLVAN